MLQRSLKAAAGKTERTKCISKLAHHKILKINMIGSMFASWTPVITGTQSENDVC